MNHIQRHLRATLRQKNLLGINYFSQNAGTEVNVANPKTEGSPILHRTLDFCPKHLVPRQVWVESLDDIKETKKGLVELHPKIFGCLPRLDLIFENVRWQLKYRDVVLYSGKSRAEMRGGGRKPHPQKGLGRARQGSIRAPQYFCGGVAHGPRSPTSYFYMLRFYKRIHGLTSTLSAKFAQDDLHVVENLEIPTDDRQYMLDLIKERNWGPSVLIVDADDIMPRNITIATDTIGHVNLMPVYGLNVYGMLKHETLVLTLSAVDEIEKKITKLLNAANEKELIKEFQKYQR